MFTNNKKQYVTVLKQDKQIKVETKIFKDNNVLKSDTSSFLIQDEALPADATSKLNILQQDIPLTYITAPITNPTQNIIKTDDIDKVSYNSVTLDEEYSITIPKNDILQTLNHYSNNIDYLISPFTLLFNESKRAKNTMNILIFDSSLYIYISDKEQNIALAQINQLTPFDQLQDSSFYEDEITGQKLYDEVYFLEIQQTLSDLVQNYYQDDKDVEFLENVNIFYNISQLSDEQLDSLHETLMAKVNYYHIAVNDTLFETVQKEDAQNYNLTTVREKQQSNPKLLWGGLAAASIIAVAGVLYFNTQEEPKPEPKEVVKKEIKNAKEKVETRKIVKAEKIKFPSHTQSNIAIVNNIKMLFDTVPYDAILKEIEIKDDSSTIVCNFIANSTSPEDMKNMLLKVYKESKTILNHQNNVIMSSIITNKGIKNKNNLNNVAAREYKQSQYISIAKTTRYLEKLAIPKSKIKYRSKQKGNFSTYNFTLESLVQKPQEFFSFVEDINKQTIPLNIKYPIEFAKTNAGILVKYDLQFHQHNKISPKPVKN